MRLPRSTLYIIAQGSLRYLSSAEYIRLPTPQPIHIFPNPLEPVISQLHLTHTLSNTLNIKPKQQSNNVDIPPTQDAMPRPRRNSRRDSQSHYQNMDAQNARIREVQAQLLTAYREMTLAEANGTSAGNVGNAQAGSTDTTGYGPQDLTGTTLAESPITVANALGIYMGDTHDLPPRPTRNPPAIPTGTTHALPPRPARNPPGIPTGTIQALHPLPNRPPPPVPAEDAPTPYTFTASHSLTRPGTPFPYQRPRIPANTTTLPNSNSNTNPPPRAPSPAPSTLPPSPPRANVPQSPKCHTCVSVPGFLYAEFKRVFIVCRVCGYMTNEVVKELGRWGGEIRGWEGKHMSRELVDWCAEVVEKDRVIRGVKAGDEEDEREEEKWKPM